MGQVAREKGRDAVQVLEEHGMGAHVLESSGRNTRPSVAGEVVAGSEDEESYDAGAP